ncbi:MAG: hypothetical protein ABI867_06995 [Kofleriaceae bacterium]
MPARDVELAESEKAIAPEAPAVEAEAPAATFTEGEIPAVAKTAEGSGPTASSLAFDDDAAVVNEEHSQLAGIYHWEDYKAAVEAGGKPELWHDQYRSGHTEADGWKQPHDHNRVYEWHLKKGVSASRALQEWIDGPTIADFRSASVADDINDIRSELGDTKFDKLFGSANHDEDVGIPKHQRLHISAEMYGADLPDQMQQIARDYDSRDVPQDAAPAPAIAEQLEEPPVEGVALEGLEPDAFADQEVERDRELV